jgi:hypothetical protein
MAAGSIVALVHLQQQQGQQEGQPAASSSSGCLAAAVAAEMQAGPADLEASQAQAQQPAQLLMVAWGAPSMAVKARAGDT